MKWYGIVTCENTVSNPLVVDSADLKGIRHWDLVTGCPIAQWDETAWLASTSADLDGDPDDVLQNYLVRLQVYSARLRAALETAGIGGIQYLPVQIRFSDGSPVSGFAIANVLSVVSALDLERSDYSFYPPDRPERQGQIKALRIPVLRTEALAGYDIIHLKEYPLYLCVSERFRSTFETGEFTGYAFNELEFA